MKNKINIIYVRELYNKVLNLLESINFENLWKGFYGYKFALYTSKEVYFEDEVISWDNRFIGNTAIKYNDRYIAIWNIEHDLLNGNEDIDILSANLVHEMFHAYQYENKETRFPRDLVTLDYPYNVYNFCLKYEENKLLSKAFYESNLTVKRQLLEKFYSIRINRQQIIGDMCKCEFLSETSEGIAEYVGTMALKQLSEEKYTERMKKYTEQLYNFSQLHLDIRRISYYSGAVFLVVAHDLGINFEHSISEQEKTIFEVITDRFEYIKIDDLQLETALIEKAINENIAYKKDLIDKYMQSSEKIAIKGDFYISGYDPMNMIKLDNKILCKTFISLTDIKTNEKNIYMGETLLEMKSGTVDKVICYYR